MGSGLVPFRWQILVQKSVQMSSDVILVHFYIESGPKFRTENWTPRIAGPKIKNYIQVHVNLLCMEARFQAELLYTMRAVSRSTCRHY